MKWGVKDGGAWGRSKWWRFREYKGGFGQEGKLERSSQEDCREREGLKWRDEVLRGGEQTKKEAEGMWGAWEWERSGRGCKEGKKGEW